MTPVTDLSEANRQLRELHAQLAAQKLEIDEKNARVVELTEQIA